MRSGVVSLVVGLMVIPTVAMGVQACLSPYGFLDFEPQPLVAPGGDVEMAPVDVSASTVDDMDPCLVSYGGDLYAFWVKETGTTEVSENIMCRVLRNGAWGDLWAVNNVNPEEGSYNDTGSRVAGFDVLVHEGLLHIVWSTPYQQFTGDMDNDIVLRTFDGSEWGDVIDIVPPEDMAEDVQPSAASTPQGLMVTWSTNNPEDTGGMGLAIVGALYRDGRTVERWRLSEPREGDMSFIPELMSTPGGTFLTWYTRSVTEFGPGSSVELIVTINGRFHDGTSWSEPFRVSCHERGESIWISSAWDGESLCLAWQHNSIDSHYTASTILYREWDGEAFTIPQDVTGNLRNSCNGKPSLCLVEGEVRVYWHTNDDGITVGNTYDLVWTTREGMGHWSPVEVFRADPDKELLEITTTAKGDTVYGTWITNMTYEGPGQTGMVSVWDVVVGPVYIKEDPLAGVSVKHQWSRAVRAWGPTESILFTLRRSGEPMEDSALRVEVRDPEDEVDTVLEGSTDAGGTIEFDHRFDSVGTYTFTISVNGSPLGETQMTIAPSPEGHSEEMRTATFLMLTVGIASVAVGGAFVNSHSVVRGRKVERRTEVPRSRSLVWRWASRLLNYVVKNKWVQGFLQMPLFVLYVVAIYIGYFGTQDPTRNFATMVGWTYYLAGILLLYAIFGRLWCYVEACGFVDTWAKNLRRGKSWLEWPEWLKNLWPGFFILLTGFWVEIVFSIDLYPWAVATFMLTILLINLFISSVFSKRTYCRYVCRDGVVEELIARYSILRIGVRFRPDSVPRSNFCIWTDEEKRPGFCSMCFSCVQNDPTVREATVEPAFKTFAEDVYKPQAVHRDEATAAVVLMGISIPYMLVLTGLWWEGVAEASEALVLPIGPEAVVVLATAMVALAVVAVHRASLRWPDRLTPSRRALTGILTGVVVSLFVLVGVGGSVGRLVALRSIIVMLCFLVPFAVVWSAEALIVRWTRNAREETAWRLLERYGLVFIPLFLGVLIARNLPLVGTWGWAVWDISVATFTSFPGGTVEPVPSPFIDPSFHFILGALFLALGVAVGAYAALQLSRRLYKEEDNAMVAFGVHVGVLVGFATLFALILSLPPF